MSDASTAQGTSLQQFLTSVVINVVVFCALITVFIVLRKKFKRIYEPKTFVNTVPARRRVAPLPAGPFSWFMPLATEVDRALLSSAGLDGYLFLRYMKFMLVISLGGCVILWPVLFPVYATGPGGQTGLDIIAISNISGSTGRFYGAVLMGWIFIAFVCFGIYREYRHFLTVRLEYLTNSAHSQLPQATTVLITQIPESSLSEAALQKIFGGYPGGIKKIHFNRDLKTLEKEIETRDKLAYKLETAQIKLIKIANKLNFKQQKKSGKQNRDDQTDLTDSEQGRDNSVPAKKRPTHKLGFLGLIGKKVDTIDYCTTELARLNPKIASMQADPSSFKMMNSCFVEFYNQAAAQMCFQAVASHHVYAMHPRYTEIAPQDIVWSNMGLTWQTRMIKSTLTSAFVAALIIFWAIPVAFVGVLSNVTYLTTEVPFLRFILDCPTVLLGLITAYLPVILLAVLMALLPIILRLCAKHSGIPTKSGIEYAVSNTYFAFLVVQVFLVVTVISSATSAIPTIIANPGSVTSTLAAKLPTSANFYISYILLQGLAISAGALAQVVPLIVYFLLGKLLDSTPRKKWARYNNLSSVGFGTVFPVYSFLAMITLTYSLISPLILIFSAFTFGAFYIAYKHNFQYVYLLQSSTMGLLFPRALQQTMVGLYFLEVCMIGLVSVGESYGSIVLMVIALIATIGFHLKLNNAFGYLTHVVPIEIASGTSEIAPKELDNMHTGNQQIPARKPVESSAYANANDSQESLRKQETGISSSSRSDLPSYTHAALTAKCPSLWIPTDSLGVGAQEIARTRADAKVTVQDTGSYIDEKGNVTWDGKTAPYDYDLRARDVEL